MSYFYKNTPLTDLFKSGGSTTIPNYVGFPQVSLANSANSPSVIHNDIGYQISGIPITQNYYIISNSYLLNI